MKPESEDTTSSKEIEVVETYDGDSEGTKVTHALRGRKLKVTHVHQVAPFDWRKVKKHEKKISALALVFAMLMTFGVPLALYENENQESDRSASTCALIEFSEICRPNGDDLAQWAPSPSGGGNYVNVDETTVGSDTTTTYNEADATNEKDIYTMTNMSSEDRGIYTDIDGVTLWLWAIRGATGTNSLSAGVRISDVDYEGIKSATTSSWVNYTKTWALNPATSAAWTITQVNALECYIQGNDSAPSHRVSQLAILVPGRQAVWPPTFTSTPDTSVVATADYSYTATANETSAFSLYDFTGPTAVTSPYNIIRPNSEYSSVSNIAGYPAVYAGDYFARIDDTKSGGDALTTCLFTSSATSQASLYFTLSTLTWTNWATITDIDVGAWFLATDFDGSESSAGAGIQPDPGNTGSNKNIFLGALGNTFANYTKQYETNPYTAGEWTTGQVDGLRGFLNDATTNTFAYWTQYAIWVNVTGTAATNEDEWFTFTPANATLWGTPDLSDVGSWDISLRANSSAGEGSAWQNFTIVVASPWGPTITSSAPTTATAGYEYNYTPTFNESASIGTVDITAPTGGTTNEWLNDTWAYYKYNDESETISYVSGKNVWAFDRLIFFRLELTDRLPADAALVQMNIDIYKNYETVVSGGVGLNCSGAWGGANGTYSGIWDEAYLQSLTPDGTLEAGGEDDGATGWWNWSASLDYTSGWWTDFENNGTFYIALSGWAFSTDSTSYGFNSSTARFDIEYETTGTAGSDWLHWDETGGYLWGTPLESDIGLTWTVSIPATSDNGLLTTWQNFSITVGEGWAPTFTSTPDTTSSVGLLYSYVATCNETVDWPVDEDFDTDATFLHWGETNHTVYGTPDAGDVGTYYVNISATSVAGYLVEYQNYSLTISLVDLDPVANAGPDQTVYINATVTFSGALSTDDNGITNYTWTFVYNGSTEYLYGVSPTFQFCCIGNYTVTLEVLDASAQNDTDTMVVHVIPVAPSEPWLTAMMVLSGITIIGLIGMMACPVILIFIGRDEDGEEKLYLFLVFVVLEGIFFGLFYTGLFGVGG